jgi:epoxyqueuosine reductase
MSTDASKLFKKMDENGCFARIVSVSHLGELKEDIEGLNREGKLDPTLYELYLSKFDFSLPAELPDAQSLIVVARPQPALTVTFHWNGRSIPFTVPPTYYDGQVVNDYILGVMKSALHPAEHRFVRATLPLKTLAAHSGLVSYGRNNITYLPKFGSYHRLVAFFSDLPCPEDQWQERQLMAGCDTCDACVKACPTGAIQQDQVLLRAGRCLTFRNELDSSTPFPDWVDSSVHNALIGCMRCQRACPYDKKVFGWSEARENFSEEDTAYLLAGKFEGDKGKEMEKRLQSIGVDLSIFPRNLEVLLRQKV